MEDETKTPPAAAAEPHSLQSMLTNATKRKEPGTASTAAAAPVNFWEESEDDFKKPTTEKKEVKTEKDPEGEENATDATKRPPLSKEMREAQANIAAGALNVFLSGAFIPAQNYKLKWKLKKKHTKEEQDLIYNKIADTDLEDLTDTNDKRLKKSFEDMLKKYQSKVDAVPLGEQEKKDFGEACKNYSIVTGKDLPPALFLYMSLGQIVASRLVDVVTD